jgi:energy-coupling factor transporter ATP-binding protein EcfA2
LQSSNREWRHRTGSAPILDPKNCDLSYSEKSQDKSLGEAMISKSILAKSHAASNPDDFEIWLSERHKWLQTAAHRLIESKAPPTEPELAELSKLCVDEATGTEANLFASVVPGSLVQAAVRPALHIRGLSEVRGVNRIKDRAFLTFGPENLTVIYGTNGSGKTGFSRVLKQACGSRAREEIHPNVFDKLSPQCEAKILVAVDKAPQDLTWTLKGGALSLLRNVHVFDSKTASNYVFSQNEARYEPSRMRFVSALIKTCDLVTTQLTHQKAALIRKLPQFPSDFSQTPASKWLLLLRPITGQIEIDKACEYTKQNDDERIAAEGALAQKDIAARLAAIVRERASVVQVSESLAVLRAAYSDERMGVLISMRVSAATRRKAASEAAEKVFATAPLDGVGQETWTELWKQARNFSETYAYPGHAFPNVDVDSRCVLCQQALTDDGKARLSHFDHFVKSGLEASAKAAEKVYNDLVNALPALPLEKNWALQSGVLKIDDSKANSLFVAMGARSAAAFTAIKLAEISLIDWGSVDVAQKKVSEELDLEEKTLKALQQDGKRKQLESRVLELRASQWLSQNRASIVEEVTRLTRSALIDKAIGLATTTALTRKHTELAKDDLHRGYQDRFSNELKLLGGKNLPVKPVSKQEGKGKVTFGLTLQGVEQVLAAEKVLSEGETRIVALAAFLADISGLDHRSPFIFDDPISSLDQDFEEKVVKRLLDLSKTRQVIVFTHRLSLLALIESEVKKLTAEAELAKVPPAVSWHVESVTSFGKNAGVTQGISIRDMKPKPAVKNLQNEKLPQLKKLYEAGDVAGYDEKANGVCTDLRILVEGCVENVLLNGVLVRFRRSVQTQGRIGLLAKITPNDCSFLDDLMTRYSVFEHSQADELPAGRPDIEDIENDVAKLSEWLEEFSKRAFS